MSILGSAEWSEWKGLDFGEGAAGDKVFLGWGDFINAWYYAFRPNRHFVTFAPTRSGKGQKLITPNLLVYKGAALVIDPKGENAWVTATARRDNLGQKTYILDPWGEVNRRYGEEAGELETVVKFNPLSILDPKAPDYVDDLAYLADALIINQGKEPHWDNSARELVAGLVSFVVEKYADKATLAQVRLLLTKPPLELIRVAWEAQQLGPESVAARKLARFVQLDEKGRPSPTDEMMSVVSTALTQTAILDSSALAESMATTGFSFDELANGEATIYLVLPTDKLETYGRWLRLMLSIAIRTTARNTKKLPLPVLFVLDEFGTVGRLSAVAQAVGLMAGLNMCIWCFLQDLNQLKKFYPDEWETFIANAEAVSFFAAMDATTCDYVTRLSGKATIENIVTYTQTRGGVLRGTDERLETYQRDLIMSDEVRRLEKNKTVIFSREKPVLADLLAYNDADFFLWRARVPAEFSDSIERKRGLDPEKSVLGLYEARHKIGGDDKAILLLEKHSFRIEYKKSFFRKKLFYVITSASGHKVKYNTYSDFELGLWTWAGLVYRDKNGFYAKRLTQRDKEKSGHESGCSSPPDNEPEAVTS